jgi:hypothetical protein
LKNEELGIRRTYESPITTNMSRPDFT